MKQRHLRSGDELSDDTTLILRGGELDSAALRADAVRHAAVYGSWAISVFAVRDIPLEGLLQQQPIIRFSRYTVMTVGAIRAARLRLEPTGRNPLHYSLTFDDLEADLVRLTRCAHRTMDNPYHRAWGDDE